MRVSDKAPDPHSGKKGSATVPGRSRGESHGKEHHITGGGKNCRDKHTQTHTRVQGNGSVDDRDAHFLSRSFFSIPGAGFKNVQHGYEISRQAHSQKQLIAYQNNLKIELARLKSPDRIARIAKHQLGLIMPTTDKTILLP